jgi:hypothetical protein
LGVSSDTFSGEYPTVFFTTDLNIPVASSLLPNPEILARTREREFKD